MITFLLGMVCGSIVVAARHAVPALLRRHRAAREPLAFAVSTRPPVVQGTEDAPRLRQVRVRDRRIV